MQKILEVKGTDWMKGLSLQRGAAVGGLFSTATGFDPFERAGYLQPSLSPTELTAPADSVKVLTSYQGSGTGYVYAHTPTKLYRYLRASPFTQTDQTTSIDVSAAVSGAIIWKGRYIYTHPTDLRSWDFSTDDVQILSGSNASDLNIRHMCIGADKNLYIADYGSIAKCVLSTGTSNNTLDVFSVDTGFTVRAILNDGRYLVILADNNTVLTTSRAVGSYQSRVYFWDMDTTQTTSNVVYDVPHESYLIGGGYLDGVAYLFGYNGIYACNYSTPPKMIMDFRGNSTLFANRPTNPYQITVGANAIYWANGAANGQLIYGYGSLPGSSKRVFFVPYQTHSSTPAHTALTYSAGQLFTATDAPKVYVHNTGSTRGNATVRTVPFQFDRPYRYGYAKVTLRTPLESGQEVNFTASTDGDETPVSDSDTRTFALHGAKKNLKFDLKPSSGSRSMFEDLSFTISPVGGAVVQRVAIYADPLDDATQSL